MSLAIGLKISYAKKLKPWYDWILRFRNNNKHDELGLLQFTVLPEKPKWMNELVKIYNLFYSHNTHCGHFSLVLTACQTIIHYFLFTLSIFCLISGKT